MRSDLDGRLKTRFQTSAQCFHMNISWLFFFLRLWLLCFLDQLFHRAHAQLFPNHLSGQLLHLLFIGQPQQCPRMAHRQLMIHHISLKRYRQFQQSQRVSDMLSGLADAGSQFFLCIAQLFDQLFICFRFFDGIEVLSLNIFQQSDLHHLLIIKLHQDGRDLLQPCQLAGTQTALTGDQLIAADRFLHQDRCKDPMLADGLCQFLQSRIIEALARLIRIRTHFLHGDLKASADIRIRFSLLDVLQHFTDIFPENGRQSFAQSRFALFRHRVSPPISYSALLLHLPVLHRPLRLHSAHHTQRSTCRAKEIRSA